MIEVDKNLFVGNADDYELNKLKPSFYFVQACKEPYHRNAVGYSGRALRNNHPEYLIAERKNRIVLNMIDADTPKYFSNVLFEKSIEFISKYLIDDNKVLIHCNQGISRSPSIGLLYLAVQNKIGNTNYSEAKRDFLEIYPNFAPKGIEQFLIQNWSHYFS